MNHIPEEPPDENEQFENLDEALDAEDLPPNRAGPEGQRELDSDLVVDQRELEEAGAATDDPDRIALLEGRMDDPDGSGPPMDRENHEAGWDVDPLAGPNGTDVDSPDLDAGPADETEEDAESDPALEVVDVDPNDMGQVPDDAPGPDSARW